MRSHTVEEDHARLVDRHSERSDVLKQQHEHQGGLSRTQTVWLAFAASMAVFGGLFVLTGPSPTVIGPLVVPQQSMDRSMPNDGIARRDWNRIIVHHSGLHFDDHFAIDRRHRDSGLKGSGFHFVIGNGSGRLADGAIVATDRWTRQEAGAHVAITDEADAARVDRLNLESIGIAIIGDGNDRAPSSRQMTALLDLVAQLQREFGVGDDDVMLHSDVAEVDSPGRYFPRSEFARKLAADR